MARTHYTVSQVRVAASCPRILFFDAEHTRLKKLSAPAVTRIWKCGGSPETTACGTLFHATVERFNQRAETDPAVHAHFAEAADAESLAAGLLNLVYWDYLDRDALCEKSGPQEQAFMTALKTYTGELADILHHARGLGKPADEVLHEMFGDRRRRVDVTFHVGNGDEVHVTGSLDYVFWDWRTQHHRILDYKLTPAAAPANDLIQVCLYGLMHHEMHKTRPEVGVLYLHPTRELVAKSWEEVEAERPVVLNLLASMPAWEQYDAQTGQGLKPPGEPQFCSGCRWSDQCERRLGPKRDGERFSAAAAPAPGRGNALWLGRLQSGATLTLATTALPTHLAVVGAAGSGKTWLAKVLAEEAILQGVPVLAIDPQGDLVQFYCPSRRSGLSSEEQTRASQYWNRVEPRIFTPGSSHGIRLCLSPLRLPQDEELAAIQDPQRRAEERDAVFATVAGNLVSLAAAGGEVKSQETFVLRALRPLAHASRGTAVSLNTVVAALLDPEAHGLDDPDAFIKKAERLKLGRLLNNLLHGTSASLFTGGVPLDLDRLCRSTGADKVPLNILYLNALPDDRQKQNFVAALATEVYRWMVTTGAEGGAARLLLYLDEAKDYIPAGTVMPPAKAPLKRLFAQGRKYGVACLICTQSPRSVDYNVFGNCSTKLIGRLESVQDTTTVAKWFAEQGSQPAWLRGRQGAEKGTFVGRWPEQPEGWDGQTFTSRELFSLHEGAWSPERVEQEMRDDPVKRAWTA